MYLEGRQCLAIFTNNINTVQLFNSLTALCNFNWMLIKVVDMIIASDIDFRVFHVPGAHNVVANSLSWMQNADIFTSDPEAIISTFQPPQVMLGATQSWFNLKPSPGNPFVLPGLLNASLSNTLSPLILLLTAQLNQLFVCS